MMTSIRKAVHPLRRIYGGPALSYVQPITDRLFFRGILAGAAGSTDYDPLDDAVAARGRPEGDQRRPFVRTWRLDASESFTIVNPDDPSEQIILTEPENRISEVGVRVSFSF